MMPTPNSIFYNYDLIPDINPKKKPFKPIPNGDFEDESDYEDKFLEEFDVTN